MQMASPIVFLHQEMSCRLQSYGRDIYIPIDQLIFRITYAGARKIVVKVGNKVGIKLQPHDLRRHAATYASRSEYHSRLSKAILSDADLPTTQRVSVTYGKS